MLKLLRKLAAPFIPDPIVKGTVIGKKSADGTVGSTVPEPHYVGKAIVVSEVNVPAAEFYELIVCGVDKAGKTLTKHVEVEPIIFNTTRVGDPWPPVDN